NPASWQKATAARDESDGLIRAVTDEQILSAYRDLARLEGVFCEPSSAASLAGVAQLTASGELDRDAVIVCVLTGSGLKDPRGAGELPSDRTNRFVRALESILTEVRGELPVGAAWGVEMRNKIPLARGLGSSAAATVGGLVAGNALLGEPLTNRELLRLATEIEGHPDNAAAALLGGFTVVGPSNGGVEALRFVAPRDLRAVLFIPDLRLETKAMRKVLPRTVPLADATANLGRVAIGVAGLAAGRFELLRVLT